MTLLSHVKTVPLHESTMVWQPAMVAQLASLKAWSQAEV
jgi:hypothetical protein